MGTILWAIFFFPSDFYRSAIWWHYRTQKIHKQLDFQQQRRQNHANFFVLAWSSAIFHKFTNVQEKYNFLFQYTAPLYSTISGGKHVPVHPTVMFSASITHTNGERPSECYFCRISMRFCRLYSFVQYIHTPEHIKFSLSSVILCTVNIQSNALSELIDSNLLPLRVTTDVRIFQYANGISASL